jgi:hypothetical protein
MLINAYLDNISCGSRGAGAALLMQQGSPLQYSDPDDETKS